MTFSETVSVDLQYFRGIHSGQMGFLLGAGPSLAKVDEKILAPYITMTVGEAIIKLPEPNYFYTCDGFATQHGLLDLAEKSLTTKIITSCVGKRPTTVPPPSCRQFCVNRKMESPTPNNISLNDSELVVGITSSNSALHLMYVMGCNPIVLLGMDGGPLNNVHAFWMLPEYYDKSPVGLRQFYGSDPQTEFYRRHADAIGVLYNGNSCWGALKSSCKDMNVINASLDSKIAAFDKMSLEEVLARYGK